MLSCTRHRGACRAAVLLPALVAALLVASRRAAALEPDDIALVVNANVPEGGRLAQAYAKARAIPPGRILALDLPPTDEMPFADYDARVVPAVRKFLKDNALERKVTCLVTFYGVPLRIGRRASAPGEKEEAAQLDGELKQAVARAEEAVARLEALAKEFSPRYTSPVPGGESNKNLAFFPARADSAAQATLNALSLEADPQRRGKAFEQLAGALGLLLGEPEARMRLAHPRLAALSASPPTTQQAGDDRQRLQKVVREANELAAKADDPNSRGQLRQIVRDHLGLLRYVDVLAGQKLRVVSEGTESAFDSELAVLWWKDGYPRPRWLANPLNARFLTGAQKAPALGPTLMVMRLDGPSEKTVSELIATCVQVEKQGLGGKVVLDARGRKAGDGYGEYDQTLRDLAALLKSKTGLSVVLEDTESLVPARSQRDVALYCGWYSLRNYVPGMMFVPGAVGFHVASSELVSLRTPGERGWVRGLMGDGVVATLGPVAEPYLQSFPKADEFFPLLLTGEPALAEVYWLTTPMVSWMNTCIGDPLYRPYKVNPPLDVKDLPDNLKVVFEKAQRPSSGPAPPPATRPAGAGA